MQNALSGKLACKFGAVMLFHLSLSIVTVLNLIANSRLALV